MQEQTIFDLLYPKYKITKPIRLIEFFAGYGSQALALKYLGVEFEHWKICEWAIKSIQAYNDLHFGDYNDYSETIDIDEIKKFLLKKGISSNYNEPMTKQQIERMSEPYARKVINNIVATRNLVNIQQVKGKDLEIVDKDKYDYILTYSFPCQDLSLAGKGKGMSDTSTRSGMLWEVERILTECSESDSLPQILLMENVPQVHGAENIEDFKKWIMRLEELGYSNYWQDLIATDYGIPQTRNRCFMISILGEYSYQFPPKKELKLKLKDLLEDNVDEKYYLSDKMVKYISADNDKWTGNNEEALINKTYASTLNTREGMHRCDSSNYISEDVGENYNLKPKKTGNLYEDSLQRYLCNKLIEDGLVEEGDVVKHSYTQQILDGNKKCVEKNDGNMIILTTRGDCIGTAINDNGNLRIRKLTPKECFRLMGVKDKDFKKIAKNQSDNSLYHLAGDSIVCDVLQAIFKELL
ncbi:MAG: DNA (cytosine-5-)-methyltransferase [Peptostreptococcaceae bacterium]|nr:DNA (cytosine-5-)-methyltransferase [Peptostreptococcaceae bacterium]